MRRRPRDLEARVTKPSVASGAADATLARGEASRAPQRQTKELPARERAGRRERPAADSNYVYLPVINISRGAAAAWPRIARARLGSSRFKLARGIQMKNNYIQLLLLLLDFLARRRRAVGGGPSELNITSHHE